MTIPAALLLAVTVAFAVTDWMAVARDDERLEQFARPATLVALIGVALTLSADPLQRTFVVAALTFGLAGDVALLRDRFVPGLAAFLVGHLAYIAAFVPAVDHASPAALATLAFIGLLAPAASRLLEALHEQALLAPVVPYALVLVAMAGATVGTGLPLAIIAALLFVTSHGLLAWNRFVQPLPGASLGGMVAYHLAQIGLVLSLPQL